MNILNNKKKDQVNMPINVLYSEIKGGISSIWEANKSEKYWEYRKKWNENPKNNIVERFPLNLDIEPTNICNLKCPMCPRTIAINNNASCFDKLGYMSMEMFKRIIDEVSDENGCNVYAVKLTHRGEPLLNPNIVEMIRYAKESGAVDVMMNTNGALLTPELSEQIIDAGIDKMLFSFDAPNKELYEKIRIGAIYEDVLENIKTFVEIRNRKKAFGTLVRTGMVLTKDTISEVDNFKKLFYDIADIISFNKEHKENPIVSNEDVYNTLNGINENVKDCVFADSQLWQRMTINWNGETEACCENYKEEYSLGNINNQSIESIWNGKKFQNIRNAHYNGEWWKIPQCKKCTLPFTK